MNQDQQTSLDELGTVFFSCVIRNPGEKIEQEFQHSIYMRDCVAIKDGLEDAIFGDIITMWLETLHQKMKASDES